MSKTILFSSMVRLAAHTLIVAACGLVLSGCGSKSLSDYNPFAAPKYKQKLIEDKPANLAYDEGLLKLNKGDYSGAVKAFDELQKTHPDVDISRKAILMQGFANYKGGNYDDAVTAMTRYLRMDSKSNDAAYAQYIIAMSFYERIPDITRDQTMALKAMAALEQLVRSHPKSEYISDAQDKLRIVRDQLAGKEMEVGRYYLEKRNYTAAINRFRDVVAKYQTTRHIEEALMRLTECYLSLGIKKEAQTAAAVLGHNFPDSRWYKDAYSLLQSDGLEPREDTGSWISKTFKKTVRASGFGQ